MAGIDCEIDLPASQYVAWGDGAQIQQCLMNLVFNAIHAMPHGGKMAITGGFDEKGNMIWLTISDTGHGIDPDELPRIFEPFYSTKT